MTRLLLLVSLCAPFAALAAPKDRPKPKLVVLQLKAGQNLDEKAAASLTTVLAGDADQVGFAVVSQADVAAMLAFQKQRQMLGCTDDGCLAELGGALGADYVLSGEVALIGSRAHESLSLLDARTGAAAGRSAGFSDSGGDALALALLARFRAVVHEARPDLLVVAPAVEPPGAAKLRARRRTAWWTLGAGGTLLAAGGTVALVARSQANALGSSWNQPGYGARYDRQRRTALAADVLLGAGLVTTGVGLWLYRTSEVPVVVVPVASGGQVGVSVAGRF
jgi:hypothetical protein